MSMPASAPGQQVMLGIHGDLHVVADDAGTTPARRHRTAVGIYPAVEYTYGRPLVAGSGVRDSAEFGALLAAISARAGATTGVRSGVWS